MCKSTIVEANMNTIEKFEEILKVFPNGIFTSKDIQTLGYNRSFLSTLLNNNLIEKVDRGIYKKTGIWDDREYVFQKKHSETVFSSYSALHILGYFGECEKMYVTCRKGYNCSSLRSDNYVITQTSDNLYPLGIIEVMSYSGNIIRVYNIERTICDMLRHKETDVKVISKVIKQYLQSRNVDKNKLLNYASKLRVEKKIKDYIDILE